MWECDYSKEPVDYRLLWLRFVRKIWILPVSMILGIVIVCSVYYCSKLAEYGGRTYQTDDILKVTYVNDRFFEFDEMYINYYTWNEIADYDTIVDVVYEELNGSMTKEDIRKFTKASIIADGHYVYLYSFTTDADRTKALAKAFRKAIIDYCHTVERIAEIKIETIGVPYDSTGLRMYNAVALGAVLGFLCSTFAVICVILTDSSVYVPATLEKRYHIPTLTCPSMSEFEGNCKRILNGLHNVAVVPADEKAVLPEISLENIAFSAVESPVENSESVDIINKSDACILMVSAGIKNAKRIERTIEQLSRMNIEIKATMLVGEDLRLIRDYYRK